MASDGIGQSITFATVLDPDTHYTHYVTVRAREGDTVLKIAARRGRPELARTVLGLNRDVKIKNGHKLRSINQKLAHGTLIRLPGTLAQRDAFDVHCGNERPIVKDGYAMFEIVPRPGRIGLNHFTGYNPLAIDIPIQFEGYAEAFPAHHHYSNKGAGSLSPGPVIDPLNPPGKHRTKTAGEVIEEKIGKLRGMAGRGKPGLAAYGPPAVIRIAVTDDQGRTVNLVPQGAQTRTGGGTPLYRITTIQWDSGAVSDDRGNRIRQTATVSVAQFTPIFLVQRSASQRSRSRNAH